MSAIDRQALERTLKTVQKTQAAYWEALQDLEEYTGLDLRRPDAEIEHMTVDEVLELIKEQKATPADFEDIAKALHSLYIPSAEVVNTGGGIDCIRIEQGKYALYFGTGGENWGASVYTVLPDGNEEWLEDADYDPNIFTTLSSDEPDPATVADNILAAVRNFAFERG